MPSGGGMRERRMVQFYYNTFGFSVFPKSQLLKHSTNVRHPLYHQNSMDFMQSAKPELHGTLGTDTFSR